MPTGLSLHFAVPEPFGCCRTNELPGTPTDARALADLAIDAGFSGGEVFAGSQVTVEFVLSALRNAAAELADGDLLLVTFSGHGCQIPDKGGWEPLPEYEYDETWCLADRQLVDDELHPAWAHFSPGVRILVISDSCFSETSFLVPNASTRKAAAPTRKRAGVQERAPLWGLSEPEMDLVLPRRTDRVSIGASVILLSACKDQETAEVRGGRSLFVAELVGVWNKGKFPEEGTYMSFIDEICNHVALANPYQHPGVAFFGEASAAFLSQRPFTI